MTENHQNQSPTPIFTAQVFEEKVGEDTDYRICVRARVGGFTLEFDKTVEQIRKFFTDRRERSEKRKVEGQGLRAVPRASKDK
jgi:hypothetical protein